MSPNDPIAAFEVRDDREGASRSRAEALVHLLGDDDAGIRATAWEHLERLGVSALDAVEVASRSSEDARVRVQSSEFLLEWRRRGVFAEWVEFCRGGDFDIESGAFLIARTEYPDADVGAARAQLDEYAAVLRRRLVTVRSAEGAVDALVELVHQELGFRGNVKDYYDADNSYFHRVIERRVGIPISLSILYLAIARRVSIPLEPVGLPLHFLLKIAVPSRAAAAGRPTSGRPTSGRPTSGRPASGRRQTELFVDPFHRGERLTSRECARFLHEHGVTFRDGFLDAISDRVVLYRMLGNLLKIYHGRRDERRSSRVTALLDLLGA